MYRGRNDHFETIHPEGPLAGEVPTQTPWLAEAAALHDGAPPFAPNDGRHWIRTVDWIDRNTPINLPWCGLFVGHCIRRAFPEHRLPFPQIRARPWLSYGEEAEPQIGAILLFWLRWEGSPFGHVGFYWGEDEENFHVLGGNQHETVLIEAFPKSRLIGCRWPHGASRTGERRRRSPKDVHEFEHASR